MLYYLQNKQLIFARYFLNAFILINFKVLWVFVCAYLQWDFGINVIYDNFKRGRKFSFSCVFSVLNSWNVIAVTHFLKFFKTSLVKPSGAIAIRHFVSWMVNHVCGFPAPLCGVSFTDLYFPRKASIFSN